MILINLIQYGLEFDSEQLPSDNKNGQSCDFVKIKFFRSTSIKEYIFYHYLLYFRFLKS